MVRRPAVFELLEGEGFTGLLEYAGGLLPDAYTERFQIERIIPFAERTDPSVARRVIDLSLADALSGDLQVSLQDGDVLRIRAITDRIDNAVTITGPVFQPGRFELSDDLVTVRDLLNAADGVPETAYLNEASLIRLRADFTEQLIVLDLRRVLADDPLHNIPMRRQDRLEISSRTEIQTAGQVTVEGTVRNPGSQPFRPGLTLQSALFGAGGLQDSLVVKEVFMERADLYRREGEQERARVIPFSLRDVLSGGIGSSMTLLPGDQIQVYSRSVERVEGRTVTVNGAVQTPGSLPFRDGLTVEDVILQAGGLSQYSYLESVRVSRPDPAGGALAKVFDVPLSGLLRDSDGRVETAAVQDMLANRSFLLQPGDQVSVLEDPNYRPLETVLISGEISFPGTYALDSNEETISSILEKAGGILATGYLGGARLTRGGRQVAVNFEKALGSNRGDMRLLPGDVIAVPRRPNTVEVLGNVNRPALIRFNGGRRVSYYLDRAGGKSEDSEAVYVTQADGTTQRLRRGLFPSNPRVTEGGVITVTLKAPRDPDEQTDVGKIITDTVSVLTATLTAIVLASKL